MVSFTVGAFGMVSFVLTPFYQLENNRHENKSQSKSANCVEVSMKKYTIT